MPYTFAGVSLPAHASGLQTSLEFSYTTNAYDAPVWADISPFGQTVRTDRGRDSTFDTFKTGTMAVGLNNTTRQFDRRYTAGTYYNGGTGLNPHKRFRWRFKYGGIEYTVFDGFLENIVNTREPSNRVGWATANVADGFKLIAAASLPTGGTVVGDGETVAARLGRIADLIGWPAGDRSFDTDCPTVHALTLSGQKALGEAQLAAGGDLGQMFMSTDNVWTYTGHRWRLSNSLTSQGTVGEDTAGGELAYSVLREDNGSDLQIFNRCTAAGTFGPLLVATTLDESDPTSITEFGDSTKPLGTLIVENLNVAQNTVEWVVVHFAQPLYRVASLRIDPLIKPTTMIPFVLGLEIGDRITVKSRPMNVGTTSSQDVYVEGIVHDFDVEGGWSVDLKVSQADSGYWRMGVSTWSSNTVWA